MDTCKALDLNNQAVAHLQHERVHEAVDLLRSALTLLKDGFKIRNSPVTPQADANKMDPLSFGDSSSTIGEDFSMSISSFNSDDGFMMDVEDDIKPEGPAILAVPVLHDMLLHPPQLSGNSAIILFDRALCLAQDETDREMVTAVIMFNLGLVHHARGIARGRSNYLSKAMNLYKMSLRVVQKVEDAPISLLLLALFNNLAQIYSHFFLLEKMRRYLDNMRLLLADDEVRTMSQDDFVWFCTNVMFNEGSYISVAPAA